MLYPGVLAWRVELSVISSKWCEFGLHLGVPDEKLEEFKEKDDPLSEVIAYWLWGNIRDQPVTWRHIVDTLRAIGEVTLADKIETKYSKKDEQQGHLIHFK